MGTNIADASTAKLGYGPRLQFHKDVEDYFVRVFGSEHFQQICKALTCPSRYACIRVNTLQTTRKEALLKLSELLHRENVNLAKSLKVENESRTLCVEHPVLHNTIIVQGDGPHEIDYSGDNGQFKEVLVSRKCAEAVLRGANVFVPGVLGCSSHIEQGDIVAVSAAIEHLDGNGDWVVGVTRGTTLLSEHGNAQLNGLDRTHCYIGKGKALLSRTSIFREHQGIAVEMIDRVYDLPPLHGVLQGDIFLQNLPSILAAIVLDPQPGESILDMCAAPGGKTTALAILMGDKGKIIATDRSGNKVMDIKRLSDEMKLKSIHAYKLDALKSVNKDGTSPDFLPINCNPEEKTTNDATEALPMTFSDTVLDQHQQNVFPEEHKENGRKMQYQSKAKRRKQERKLRNGTAKLDDLSGGQRLKGFLPHSFDKVLLDPPCSALGLRPRLFAGEETIDSLRRHASYQKRMFDQAVQLCRPGGTIVYSTCTINPGENEAVVRYALDTYSSLSLVPQTPKLGGPGLTGGIDDGVSYKQWLRQEEKDLVQRFDPSGPLDTIGFFIAKFQVN